MTLETLIPRAGIAALTFAAFMAPLPTVADSFFFSTGNPDGRIGTLLSLRPGPIGSGPVRSCSGCGLGRTHGKRTTRYDYDSYVMADQGSGGAEQDSR